MDRYVVPGRQSSLFRPLSKGPRQVRLTDLSKVTNVGKVKRIASFLRRATVKDDLLDALTELDDYHVSLEVLERTGVGIVVNKLRKSQFPEVARLAQAKVLDWKAVAKVGIDRRNSSKALDPWFGAKTVHGHGGGTSSRAQKRRRPSERATEPHSSSSRPDAGKPRTRVLPAGDDASVGAGAANAVSSAARAGDSGMASSALAGAGHKPAAAASASGQATNDRTWTAMVHQKSSKPAKRAGFRVRSLMMQSKLRLDTVPQRRVQGRGAERRARGAGGSASTVGRIPSFGDRAGPGMQKKQRLS